MERLSVLEEVPTTGDPGIAQAVQHGKLARWDGKSVHVQGRRGVSVEAIKVAR